MLANRYVTWAQRHVTKSLELRRYATLAFGHLRHLSALTAVDACVSCSIRESCEDMASKKASDLSAIWRAICTSTRSR